jgi:5,10-methylenetetrahydromethanopterin reductase
VIDSQLLCRDVFVTLSLILDRTSTLLAATGVTQPVTRHASVVAGAMASLQELSGGRAVLGVGTGFSSLGTIGLAQARIADVEAFVATTRSLLAGQETRFAADVVGRLAWVAQPSGVPIAIAATGPRMTRAAGRVGDQVIIHQGLAPAALDRALGWVSEGAAIRAPDDRPAISCWAPFSMAPTRTEAYSRVRARVAGLLATARLEWFEGAERTAVEHLKAAYDIADHASPSPRHAALVPDSLIPHYALAGDAAEVRDNLVRLLAHPGVDRVILTPQVPGAGALPVPEVLRTLETAVLARL